MQLIYSSTTDFLITILISFYLGSNFRSVLVPSGSPPKPFTHFSPLAILPHAPLYPCFANPMIHGENNKSWISSSRNFFKALVPSYLLLLLLLLLFFFFFSSSFSFCSYVSYFSFFSSFIPLSFSSFSFFFFFFFLSFFGATAQHGPWPLQSSAFRHLYSLPAFSVYCISTFS